MSSPRKCLIYCRVSHTKQKTAGGGLQSQEHRCRTHALAQGYNVEAVFPDDVSGGGDFMNRKGMVALLSHLEDHPGQNFVVLFDDLKRFSRDTMFHWKLRYRLMEFGAEIECLTFKFEDTPEGEFVETVFAAQGQLERKQNRRQTIQKMKARLERGFWVFQALVGYRYEKTSDRGKLLVPDEPVASIIREGLEGFANGRFQTKAELARFLQSKPHYPKDTNGEVRQQRVQELLTRPIYAGYVEAPSWNIARSKGQHEGLIRTTTFLEIRNRLNKRAQAPVRKNLDEDFPLRGFVLCSDCEKPLTACWSGGRKRKYPYYYCYTKGCESRSKSIAKDKIEGEFETLLKKATGPSEYLQALKLMVEEWCEHLEELRLREAGNWKSQAQSLQQKIDTLMGRLIEALSEQMVRNYESAIEKLEMEKVALAEKQAKSSQPVRPLSGTLRTASLFLSNLHRLWGCGDIGHRHAVLKLAFSGPIFYRRGDGFSNTNFSFIFKHLRKYDAQKSKMAHLRGFEPLIPGFVDRCLIQFGHRCVKARYYLEESS